MTSSTGSSGTINREHFSYGELSVWVEAKNDHGSNKSEVVVLNVADIIKPPPPKVTLRLQKSIDIEWNSFCNELQLSVGTCDVRHRIEVDQIWLEHDGGFSTMYRIENPQPCTVYEFQVRCACGTALTSDWSAIQSIRSVEKNPEGKTNIWWDCLEGFNCALTWENLAVSQTCSVQGYNVSLFYKNGSAVFTTEESDQLCDEMRCHLNTSLKDVSSFNVSAFNAHGATQPSHLVLPKRSIACQETHMSKEDNKKAINLKMNEVNLTVSWNLSSWPSDNLKEYVVQYKQVGCPPGKGFAWVRVKENQTTAFFKGDFKNGTRFNVSLFSVSHSMEVHQLSSVIGYSLEGIPAEVSLFKVSSIGATQVTLKWELPPESKQNGMILYYQIGIGKQLVYNVSAQNHKFSDLSPGQKYEVWIRAVSAAGPGANATTTFKTPQDEKNVYLIPAVLIPVSVVLVALICLFVSFCICNGEKKVCPWMTPCLYEKVPDPSNSHIFRQMKHQLNDSLAWICIPVNESHPKISMLEVVEKQPEVFVSSPEKTSDNDELTTSVLGDGCSKTDCQDDQSEDAIAKLGGRANHRYGRKEYSKMVDSDEERDKEEVGDDCSSEEEQCTLGYEKHFMPTASEILEV